MNRPMYCKTGASYLWPLPEQCTRSGASGDSITPREAHPFLLCVNSQVTGAGANVPAAMSIDTYDLDCPALLAIMQSAGATCWQLRGLTPDGKYHEPIGLVRLTRYGTLTVNVLPWRYTSLSPLIEQVMMTPQVPIPSSTAGRRSGPGPWPPKKPGPGM